MTKLHEVLAAEGTVVKTWNDMFAETLKKLANMPFFLGETKSLKMIKENPGNQALEDAAKSHTEVRTNVFDTMDYALGIWGNAEDLLYQKNLTNAKARGTVFYKEKPLLVDMPVDQLLGLEARFIKIKELMLTLPTLDASKIWAYDSQKGCYVSPEEYTVKTENIEVPVELSPANDKHPAQVKLSTRVDTVGKFTVVKRSGAATAVQKANAIQVIDDLLVEVKKARMRANEATVEAGKISDKLLEVILAPLKTTA